MGQWMGSQPKRVRDPCFLSPPSTDQKTNGIKPFPPHDSHSPFLFLLNILFIYFFIFIFILKQIINKKKDITPHLFVICDHDTLIILSLPSSLWYIFFIFYLEREHLSPSKKCILFYLFIRIILKINIYFVKKNIWNWSLFIYIFWVPSFFKKKLQDNRNIFLLIKILISFLAITCTEINIVLFFWLPMFKW